MSEHGLTLFDGIVIAVVVLSTLFALMRGAVREVLSFASWIGALIAAFYLFARVRPMMHHYVVDSLLSDVLAGIAVFLVPLIVFRLVASLIAGSVAAGPLGAADKLLGLALGAARGVLVVAAAYLFLSWILPPAHQPPWVVKARFYPQVREAALFLQRALPERVRLQAEDAAQKTGEVAKETGKAAQESGYGDASRAALDRLLPGKP